MKCPDCHMEMLADTRDMDYEVEGRHTIIAAVHGMYCPQCGQAVLDAEESQRVSEDMLSFRQECEG